MGRSGLRYLVVEGPIGVGKTTLVHRLARSLGGQVLLEDADDNPFLDRFYANPGFHGLATQLHFLLQRVAQMEALHQGDLFAPLCIADFMLAKDRLFAEINLTPAELVLYHQIHDRIVQATPAPDLVVYLQAPTRVLLERIRRRGRAAEGAIDESYLERLGEAYSRFFLAYHGSPLLIVNAADLDFAHVEEHYGRLLEAILGCPGGRHYFNPGVLP